MMLIDLQRLEKIAQLNANKSWVNKDLYRMLCRRDIYLAAYERIKSKPGNMTPGVDGSTLDGFSLETIDRIIESMKDESFQFSPARRVLIPKPNGKKRPLGISSPVEKLVQEAMRMLLESIYDSAHGSSFSDQSYGFRRGRGPHSALREVRTKWTGVRWMIEGDIEAFFDNIDHEKMISLLRLRIEDERFLNLVRKALSAGVLIRGNYEPTLAGTPQGSIVSPILANIYLDAFDKKVAEIIERESRGNGPRPNPEYRSLVNRLYNIRSKGNPDPDEVKSLKRKMRELPSKRQDDPNFIRVHYVRYADDWLIGIIGPKELASKVRAELAAYLKGELKLTLNFDKTHIRHASSEEAFFLGTRISSAGARNGKLIDHIPVRDHKTAKRRAPRGVIHLRAPLGQLVDRLHQNGFCTREGEPTSKRAWTVMDDDQIIRRFNLVMDGILEYYSFTDNFYQLRRIQYILQHSAAKTLSHKHKVRSLRKIFAKHGHNLSVYVRRGNGETHRVSLRLRTKFSTNPWDFKVACDVPEEGDLKALKYGLRTRSSLGYACSICESTDRVQMHHVRHIRKMGAQAKGFTKIMAALNRKQLPVCHACHRDIHAGRYDGEKLSKLAGMVA